MRRPLIIKGGDATALKFDNTGTISAYMPIEWGASDISSVIKSSRQGGNQISLHTVVYSDGTHATAGIFLGHSGGTKDAPTAPGPGWTLGAIQFGAMAGTLSGSQQTTGQVRALTDEAWTFGTAQGTRLEFLVQRRGTVTNTVALTVDTPYAEQAGMRVLVNRAGTIAPARVHLGPVDSGGTGYRQLLIEN